MLQKRNLQEIFEEIKVSRQLYPEFASAEPLVYSLYKAKDSYFKKASQTGTKGTVSLTAEEAAEKLGEGSPLVENPVVARTAFFELSKVVSAEFIKIDRGLKDATQQMDFFMADYFPPTDDGTLQVKDMPAFIAAVVENTAVKRDLATFIVTFTLPSLFDHYYNLDDTDNIDVAAWDKGSCPICGVLPHYGLLKDKEGIRMLDCWLCGFRWGFPRLKCPYCLNTEQHDLGFFTVGTSESCRIHFCKKCTNYVKVFDLRNAINEDAFLPVHNMATLSYDLFALKEGFKPGSGLQWVNVEEHNQSAN